MLAYRRQRGLHQRSPQLSEPSRGRRGGGRRTWRAAARLHGGHTHGRRAGRLKGVIGPTAAGLFSNSAPSASQAVRATYVDEIDSDDSDDDEREWSLRHALEEFGVTKVRVKGKQGVALFGSEKDASDALHAHRLGAWRLSSPSVDASGEQILYQGASSPQVEDDLERLLAAGGT